jgi:predicted NUDIX family phosphoesterase
MVCCFKQLYPNVKGFSMCSSKAHHTHTPHHEEYILVVKRDFLFPQQQAWQGLRSFNHTLDGFATYQGLIKEHQEFLPRVAMEVNPSYKQIIPYLVYEYEERYFLMQRTAQGGEQRLHNKYSLGIGGHIRHEDMLENSSIIDWTYREFHEEVEFNGTFSVEPLGIINDDSNEVGKVHIGFVFLLKGDSPIIKVKSELRSGVLLPLEELVDFKSHMENWSQLVLEYLFNKK